MSLIHAYNQFSNVYNVKNNSQLLNIIIKFNHIYHANRPKFVRLIYNYFKDEYPT